MNNYLWRSWGNTTQRFLFSTQHKIAQTQIKVKGIQESIKRLNDAAKEKTLDKKDEKHYMTKMSPDRIDKIGSHTLLDK